MTGGPSRYAGVRGTLPLGLQGVRGRSPRFSEVPGSGGRSPLELQDVREAQPPGIASGLGGALPVIERGRGGAASSNCWVGGRSSLVLQGGLGGHRIISPIIKIIDELPRQIFSEVFFRCLSFCLLHGVCIKELRKYFPSTVLRDRRSGNCCWLMFVEHLFVVLLLLFPKVPYYYWENSE